MEQKLSNAEKLLWLCNEGLVGLVDKHKDGEYKFCCWILRPIQLGGDIGIKLVKNTLEEAIKIAYDWAQKEYEKEEMLKQISKVIGGIKCT